MDKDNQNIINIYESSSYQIYSKGLDYLNENTDNFDWDIFIEKYSYAKLYLNEKFEYIGEKQLPQDAKEFTYIITTPDGSKYTVQLNIFLNSSKLMDTAMLASRSKNDPQYKKLLDTVKINRNEYQLYISFYDDTYNYKLTGNNKPTNESFVVFKSLENALNHFMYTLNYFDTVNVIKFYVDNNETKRKDLYKRILNRSLDKSFSNYLEDNLTDPKYTLLTLFKN